MCIRDRYNIWCEGAWGWRVTDSWLEYGRSGNLRIDKQTISTGYNRDGNFINCRFAAALSGSNIELHGPLYVHFMGNSISTANQYGVFNGGYYTSFINNWIESNDLDGIYSASTNAIIETNYFYGNGRGVSNTCSQITLKDGATRTVILGNTFNGKAGTSRYAISANANATNCIISDNVIYAHGYVIPIIYNNNSTKIRDNIGYVSENSGWAGGTSGFTIAHGCAKKPSYVDITPSGANPISYSFTVDNSNITVYHSDAGSAMFSWKAEI